MSFQHLVFFVISLVVGIVVFLIGQATIKRSASDEEIIAQVTGE